MLVFFLSNIGKYHGQVYLLPFYTALDKVRITSTIFLLYDLSDSSIFVFISFYSILEHS
jgi:hypothetical protein